MISSHTFSSPSLVLLSKPPIEAILAKPIKWQLYAVTIHKNWESARACDHLRLGHDGATLKPWSYSRLIHLLSRQQKQGRAQKQPALAYLADLIGLNLPLQSHRGLCENRRPLPRRAGGAAAASTQSERRASTLQGEGKERTTIWGLVMVMPGAGAQGQGDCWGLRRGWGRVTANGYGVVGQVMAMMKLQERCTVSG